MWARATLLLILLGSLATATRAHLKTSQNPINQLKEPEPVKISVEQGVDTDYTRSSSHFSSGVRWRLRCQWNSSGDNNNSYHHGYYQHPADDDIPGKTNSLAAAPWTNDASREECMAGPFLLGSHLNASLFHELCSTPDAKYGIIEMCRGSWYVNCSSQGYLTLNKCKSNRIFRNGKCELIQNTVECKENLANLSPPELLLKVVQGKRLKREKRELMSSLLPKLTPAEKCTTPGLSLDPDSCNKYKVCSAAGRISTHTCVEGTLFNPLTDVCDFEDNVDCSSRKGDLGSYACDKEDSYRAPHPDHCNQFVECDHGNLAVKTCPPATLYQRDDEECQHAFRVTCPKKVSLAYDMKRRRRSVYRRRARSINKLGLACEFNYIAPHPTSCTRFVECEDGRIFIKSCGPGTSYNALLGQCDWPHNVRQPDPSGDCVRYQQCVRNQFQPRSCPQGHYFDPVRRKCERGSEYEIRQCSRREPIRPPPPRTTTPPPYIEPPQAES